MLLRDRSGEPSPDQLAVNNQLATPDKYRREVSDAIGYWQNEEVRAKKTGSEALLSMSGTILRELSEKGTWTRANRHLERLQNRVVAENARRRVLSALGISSLLRVEWEGCPPTVPDLVGPGGELGMVLDIVVDERLNPERRSESRVHTPTVAPNALPVDANEQWYREGELWVRQVRPVEPTDYLMNIFLPRMGIENPNLAQHETLYPYIAVR